MQYAVAWMTKGKWHFHLITKNKAFALAELKYCREMLGLNAKLFRQWPAR